MQVVQTQSRAQITMGGFSLVELLIVMAFLAITLGILGGSIIVVAHNYVSQRQLIEAQNNARVALDTMLRFTRMAGNNPQGITFDAIEPDPDGNTQADSIQLQGDWNPADGDVTDRYENIIFTTNNGVLYKEEPSFDTNPVEFVDSIESLTFTYRDADNVPIADPISNNGDIAFVDIELRTQVPNVPAMVFKSSATMRARRE
ncbi:hypothetical protein MYX75_11120 [Acidobacteria bacterium AH-259-A15]|nr:hypothetical protein [Acidobacteria bacterium AH-259-A15]